MAAGLATAKQSLPRKSGDFGAAGRSACARAREWGSEQGSIDFPWSANSLVQDRSGPEGAGPEKSNLCLFNDDEI